MEIDSYGVIQSCLNGHILTDQADDATTLRQKYCADCGEPIINCCPACQVPVKGRPRTKSQSRPPFAYFDGFVKRPAFCINCGTAYPWTQRGQESIQQLIEFSDSLKASEKEDFKEILPALIVNTPKTTLAIVKCKTFLQKAGVEVGKGIKDILKEIVTETVKKAIWPD